MKHTTIQSSQNATFKALARLLQKSRERKKTQTFVVEGQREIQRAMANDFVLKELWIRKGHESDIQHHPTFELNGPLYDRITQRGGSEPVLAVFEDKGDTLSTLALPKKAKVLVAEAPEKPGNLGALLRTAAAVGLDAVLIANPKTDLYNPQAIRNSLGGIFSVPVIQDSTEAIIDFLQQQGFFIAAAALHEKSIPYTQCHYTTPCAVVVGTEATGLQDQWIDAASVCVQIPVQPPIDSLNVSVAAGILVYHAFQ